MEAQLIDTPSRTAYFQQQVLANIAYWQQWVAEPQTEVDSLKEERHRIVAAITFALNLPEAWPTTYQLIMEFSSYMERWGEWSHWGYLLHQASQTAEHLGETAGVINLSALSARILLRQNHFKVGVKRYRHTVRLARQIGDQFNEARAYTNLGYHYAEQGQWHRSEVLCCHALNLFEQIGSDYGRAHTENHLGFLYTWRCEWDQAQRHLKRACTIWQKMEDEHGLMRGYINLAAMYLRIKQAALALTYLNKALHQAKLTGEEASIGTVYSNMGYGYFLNNELVKAKACIAEAIEIFQHFSDMAGLGHAWNILGVIYVRQDNLLEAMCHFEKSFDVWHTLGNKLGKAEVLMDMIEYHLTREEYQQAQFRVKQTEDLIGPNPHQKYEHFQPRLIGYREILNALTGQ